MQDGSPQRKALDLDDLTEKIEDCEQSNFELTSTQERQGDKFYHLPLNSDKVPPPQLQPHFPTFK